VLFPSEDLIDAPDRDDKGFMFRPAPAVPLLRSTDLRYNARR